jgi:hypothetical protein
VTSSMLSRLLPSLASLLFWRKKPRQDVPDTAIPPSLETKQAVNESDASHSREILKVLKLEREIIGTALTTIYESEAQGIITRDERDRLIDKYSADLKQLESRISEHQRIVDIFDLESAKKELVDSFQTKMSEIDKKLEDLRQGKVPILAPATEPSTDQVTATREAVKPMAQTEIKSTGPELRDARIKAEKKIEAIREEVLKAMERLEQIESEE